VVRPSIAIYNTCDEFALKIGVATYETGFARGIIHDWDQRLDPNACGPAEALPARRLFDVSMAEPNDMATFPRVVRPSNAMYET
jgi:hypothetical protein